jgi:RNA polymerase sigma factor (sigma-70 family)
MDQEQAFLQAFDDHADNLFRHAYFRVSNRQTARDLVQDTYAKVWEYVAKGNTIEQFRPFLYRTLNNAIIDEYRKRRIESLDALLDEDGAQEGYFDELKTGGRDEQEFSFDAKQLQELLETLPEQYRRVVVYRFIDELQPQEIAEQIGETVNAVSVRIHRGLAMLRKEYLRRESEQ